MKVKRILLLPKEQRKHPGLTAGKNSDALVEVVDEDDDDIHQVAWVIDDALSEEFIEMVQMVRQSLPLDTKRPTVKRRFFSAADKCPAMIDGLRKALQTAIISSNNNNILRVHVLSYMRYLEYDQVGGHLDPHTDGNKVCEDTQKQSTHTMLLYLRDCQKGGETILLEPFMHNKAKKNKKKQQQPQSTCTAATSNSHNNKIVVEAVQPKLGRILLFPHPIWHEGAPIEDVPKICLRAEVCLYKDVNDNANI